MRTILHGIPSVLRAACLAVAIGLLAGCDSEVTQPRTDADLRVLVDPGRDLGDDTFTLKTLQAGSPDHPATVVLVGQNLRVDSLGFVALDVSVLNQSERLLQDVIVWLSSFQPSDVLPANADILPVDDEFPADPIWGFDYTSLLGEDGILSPGEVSAAKEWQFHAAALGSFSFAAHVGVGADPQPGGRISGLVFWDANENGRLDRGEDLLAAGSLRLDGPDGTSQETFVGPDARYTFAVDAPGLYAVHFLGSPFATPLPFVLTTPNPLQVILLADDAGGVRTFDAAHFGARPFPTGAAPIQLTDRPPGAIRQDAYQLIGMRLAGRILHTHVGFSGCSPDHPLQLYMSGAFMESHPVRARIVLMHDDRGELCDAAWSGERDWDLSPIVRLYAAQYGSRSGSVILQLVTPNGDVHEVLFEF